MTFQGGSTLALACRLFIVPALLLLLSAPHADAVVTGGCTAQATASKSGAIDLTTQAEWHVRSEDDVSGSGTAPADQTFVQISAYAFGVGLPVLSATGKGRSGSAGPYALSNYTWIARIISVSGNSDSCSGYVTLIVDDANPLLTAAGGGGAALGVIGLLGVLGAARGRGGPGGRIGGGLAGLIAGLGIGLLLQQAGALDPRSLLGLALLAGGVIIGGAAAGALRRT